MFTSITPGAAIAALIAVFWVLSICSSEDEPKKNKINNKRKNLGFAPPKPKKPDLPSHYTEGWQDESVHWHVDRYGRLLDENDGVYINPLL
jgi:hypothetical protein